MRIMKYLRRRDQGRRSKPAPVQQRHRRFMGFESLEPRYCLSATFVENPNFAGFSLSPQEIKPESTVGVADAVVPSEFSGKINPALWSAVDQSVHGQDAKRALLDQGPSCHQTG